MTKLRALKLSTASGSEKRDDEEEIRLLYGSREQKESDEKEGIVAYRAVKQVITGGSYFGFFAENWTEFLFENALSKNALKLFLLIGKEMQQLNVWKKDAQRLSEISSIPLNKVYQALRELEECYALSLISKKTKEYFVNPDLIWKGRPTLMGRAPKGYRFSSRKDGWERFESEATRKSLGSDAKWYEDTAGCFWLISYDEK